MTKRKKKKRGWKGNGLGPHQEVSPLARGTITPSKQEQVVKEEKKRKQYGWVDGV